MIGFTVLVIFHQGTAGLSMFYLEVRDEQGRLNNLEIQRLKDKLGTRQLPTAELLLDGTRAFKVKVILASSYRLKFFASIWYTIPASNDTTLCNSCIALFQC